MANKIAEKYSWRICPCGEITLNSFGFSIQVPNTYEYVSDGPYRTYIYLGKEIYFKHTNNRNISMYSKELSLVIQVITALGKKHITESHVLILAQYCHKNVKEDLLQDTKYVVNWIYDVFKQINEVIVTV
jgi:hypothetical protein